ncbi:hypothetical protein HOY80DRAFT_1034170 [Tuber brumale]|nr:hypothetical protein HOY80DRAFT_1034170 [Tuber brumale]
MPSQAIFGISTISILRGGTWSILDSPDVKSLILMVLAHVDQLLTLPNVIFLYSDDALRAWLLSTESKEPLDHLVIEPRQGQEGLQDSMTEPLNGSNQFFKHQYEEVSDMAELPEDVDAPIDNDGSRITISDDDYGHRTYNECPKSHSNAMHSPSPPPWAPKNPHRAPRESSVPSGPSKAMALQKQYTPARENPTITYTSHRRALRSTDMNPPLTAAVGIEEHWGLAPQSGAGRQPLPGPAGSLDSAHDNDDPLTASDILSPSSDIPLPVSPTPSSHAVLKSAAGQPVDALSGQTQNTATKAKEKGKGKKGRVKRKGKGKALQTRRSPIDEDLVSPTPSAPQRRAWDPADQ